MFAVSAPVLVGVAALGVDVAFWQSTRLALQQSADQASLAAGAAKQTGANPETEARGVAAANGFVHGVGGVTVTVNSPPASGPNAGDIKAVEVVMSQLGSSLFSAMLRTPPTITTRSVSVPKAEYSGGMCVMALATTGSGISMTGSTAVDAPNCNIYSNSTATGSVSMGGSSQMRGYLIRVAGTISSGGSSSVTGLSGVQTGVAPTADPYASRTMPSFSGCNATAASLGSGAVVTAGATPYVFCNGLSINGATVTFNPGVYVIDRGTLNIASSAAINAPGGVTFILTSSTGANYATLNMSGSASVSIRAPSSGPTAGIAVWVDGRSSATISLTGSTAWTITGAFYAPSTNLSWRGVSSSTCTQIVARQLSFNGNSGLDNKCAGVGVAHPPGSVVPAAMALKE